MANDRMITFSVKPDEMIRIREEAQRRGVPHTSMIKAILERVTSGYTDWEIVPMYVKHNVRTTLEDLKDRVQPQIVQLDTETVPSQEEEPVYEDFGPSTVVPRTWTVKRK